MHPKFCTGRLLLGFAVLSLLVGGTAMAQPLERIVIPLGSSLPVQMKNKQNIKTVFVEKEGVVGAEQYISTPSVVLLKALTKGTSRVELTDNAGVKESYEVVVGLTVEQRII